MRSGDAGVRKSRGVGPPHPRPLSPTGGEGRISVFSWVLYAKGCGMNGLGLESPSYEWGPNGAELGLESPSYGGSAMSGSRERSSGVIK